MVQVDYYRNPSGEMPAKEYIDGLTASLQAEALVKIRDCLKNQRTLNEGPHLSRKQNYWILFVGTSALICRWRSSTTLEIVAGISERHLLSDQSYFQRLDLLAPHSDQPITVGV